MSNDSNVDRDSFQQFLAHVFVVQESQNDPQFLSAMIGVQRLITTGELGIDSAMNLIVDSARDVAGAAGVAIGLLEGHKLIFRAGAGCSAARIGTRVAASLTASAKTKSNREILRVENAQTDTRIEGAICRQFGAESILILAIYRGRPLVGVLEILFSQAHAFQDCEVQMYRLMAGLVETAMDEAFQARQSVKHTPSVIETTVDAVPSPRFVYLRAEEGLRLLLESKNALQLQCRAAWKTVKRSRVCSEPDVVAKAVVQKATDFISTRPIRSLAFAAIATGVGLTFWIGQGHQGPVLKSPVLPGSTAVRTLQSASPIPAEETLKTGAPAGAKATRLAAIRRPRARVGRNEVDYIGDDVTVRHFTYQSATQKTRFGAGRVSYVGDDVTVRYFTPKAVPTSR
ncbi:MAG: GAF domain-containing protein [Candidatus Sulfotelmatobacter sp.]